MRSRNRHVLATFLVLALFGATIGIRAVTEPKNDFRFSILGDRTGGAQPEIYGRIWREVDMLQPDFVINVGDTIQGKNEDRLVAEWTELKPLWQRYGRYPLYFTPGNHDIWNDLSEQVYREQTKYAPYYGFNYQEAHFTVLDNSRSTELTEEQLKFLESDLEANRDRRPKFIFFHKPYWIAFLKVGSGEFPLHQIARKHGVSYVISGHGHQFVRMQREGIVYMEVGSSGGKMGGLTRGEGFSQGWFYHHVSARVRGSKVEMMVKELDGPAGRGRMFKADDWTDKGPKFDPEDPAQSENPPT